MLRGSLDIFPGNYFSWKTEGWIVVRRGGAHSRELACPDKLQLLQVIYLVISPGCTAVGPLFALSCSACLSPERVRDFMSALSPVEAESQGGEMLLCGVLRRESTALGGSCFDTDSGRRVRRQDDLPRRPRPAPPHAFSTPTVPSSSGTCVEPLLLFPRPTRYSDAWFRRVREDLLWPAALAFATLDTCKCSMPTASVYALHALMENSKKVNNKGHSPRWRA